MIRLAPPSNSARQFAGRTSPRAGFSLLELLLVLGIVAVVAALAWPNVIGMLKTKTLQENAEQVRIVLDHARVVAIEEGRTVQVRFEVGPNPRRYVFLPEAPGYSGVAQGIEGEQNSLGARQDPFHVYTMTEACTFFVNTADPIYRDMQPSSLGEPWLMYLDNGSEASGVSWTPPVLFFPDGTATDGKAIIVDQSQQAIQLWVRGLTGAVVQSPVRPLVEFTNGTR